MKIFFVSLIFGLICLLSSCAKQCQTGQYNASASNPIKSYFFKPGSYWVYQDSASGIIDSQSVYNYYARYDIIVGEYYSGNGGTCNDYGDAFYMYTASFWNGVAHDSIGFSNAFIGLGGFNIQISFSSITSENDIYSFSSLGNQNTTLTNFSVGGQIFPTVYRDNSIFNSQIYHVQNVGVVKWVFNDTINGQRTWNLLRYHVVNP